MGTGQSLAESTPAPAAEAVSSVPAAPDTFDYSAAWQQAGEQFLQQQAGAVDAPLAPPSLPGEPPVAPEPSTSAPAPAAPVDAAPVTQTPATQGQRPSEAVPYERFAQVNSENQRLAQEAQQAREHAAEALKAAAAGFGTVTEYKQADAYAKQNKFASIEAMQVAHRNAQQLQVFDNTLKQQVDNGELSEWARQNMLRQEGQLLATQAMLQEQQMQQQFTQTQLVEQAMTNATNQFAQFGIPMSPAMTDHLRTLNPVDIARVSGEQVAWAKSVVQNANAQYAATKLGQQQQIPPMGAGGAPPPPMRPPARADQFSPSSGTFMDAMGFDPDKVGPSAAQIRELLDRNRG